MNLEEILSVQSSDPVEATPVQGITPVQPTATKDLYGSTYVKDAMEQAGALFAQETAIGALIDAANTAVIGDADFNQFSYVESMEAGPRKDIALRMVLDGALDDDRLLYGDMNAEEVENLIDLRIKENSRENLIANANGLGLALGVGASLFDATTLIPVGGIAIKAYKAAKVAGKVGIGAGLGLADAAITETALGATRTQRSKEDILFNLGASTALGGGIGALGALWAKASTRATQAQAFDPNGPDVARYDYSMGAAEVPREQRFANETPLEVGKKFAGQWTNDIIPILKANPTTALYTGAGLGLKRTVAAFQKLGVVGPFEGHSKGVATGNTVEDAIDINHMTRATVVKDHVARRAAEFRKEAGLGGITNAMKYDGEIQKVYRQAALYAETGDASRLSNDIYGKYARQMVEGDNGMRAFFQGYLDEAREAGILSKDTLLDLQADKDRLVAEMDELKRISEEGSGTTARRTRLEKSRESSEATTVDLQSQLDTLDQLSTPALKKAQERVAKYEGYIDELEEVLSDGSFTSAKIEKLAEKIRKAAADGKSTEGLEGSLGRTQDDRRAYLQNMVTRERANLEKAREALEETKVKERERLEKGLLREADKRTKLDQGIDVEAEVAIARKTKEVEKVEARIAKAEAAEADSRNYFARHWSFARMTEDPDTLVNILADDWAKADVSPEMVAKAHKDADDLLSLDEVMDIFEEYGINGDAATLRILRDNAEKRAIYAKQEAEEVVARMREGHGEQFSPLAKDDLGTSSRVHGRRLVVSDDALAEIYENGYLLSDVQAITQSYARAMGSRLELKRQLSVDSQSGLEPLRREILAEIDELAAAQPENADKIRSYGTLILGDSVSDGGMLNHYVNRLMGRYDHMDQWDNAGSFWAGQARKLTTLNTLGGAAISSLTDAATMIHTMGLGRGTKALAMHARFLGRTKKTLEQIPDPKLRVLLAGLENFQAGGRFGKLMDSAQTAVEGGIGTHSMRTTTAWIEKGLNVGTDALMNAQLMTSWNTAGKMAAHSHFLDTVHELAHRGGKLEGRLLEDMARWGLDAKDIEMIGKMPFADTTGWGVQFPDFDKWRATPQGQAMETKVFRAMKRAGEEAILSVRSSDKPVYMDKPVWSLLMQFMSFGITWSNRIGRRALYKGVLPRDVRAVAMSTTLLGTGALVYAAKEKIRGNELPDTDSVDGVHEWIYNAVDRGGYLGAIQPQMSAIYGTISGQTASRYAGRNMLGVLLGVNFGKVEAAVKGVSGLAAAPASDDFWKEVEKAANQLRKLHPFQNLWWLDGASRAVRQAIE